MRHLALAGILILGLAEFSYGAWIPVKAWLSQVLLEHAWRLSKLENTRQKPWPWADTWPVARLVSEQWQQSQIVLHGGHGESLAFGPGQVSGGDEDGGPTVIGGHRDTHFQWLKKLQPGHQLLMQSLSGDWQHYEVLATRVVDSRKENIALHDYSENTLLLVTCYPFDGVSSSGPLRFVVEAQAVAGIRT